MVSPVIPWVSQTHPVRDGEEVRALIKNRHPNELQQRTDHLKQRLDDMSAGEALISRDVAFAAGVKVGHAVYWDADNLQYDRALASVVFDSLSGGYVVAPSSYVVGICSAKPTSQRGDIITAGLLKDFDFTEGAGVTGQSVSDSGAYYLSASVPGTYTLQKPPVGVFVAFLRGDGAAHIQPTPREVLENHIHFTFDLFAQPAGTVECPAADNIYRFTVEDEALPGWLPVSNPIFGGTAPPGAKYGYNLALHPQLSRVFPPIPVDTAYLESDGIGVPMSRYMITATGIWWFDDCYGKAPWPTEPRPCSSSSYSSSSSSSSSSLSSSSYVPNPEVCNSGPYLEEMGFHRVDPRTKVLRIYFTKMVYKTNNAVVTSLEPESGSPITVKNCDGEDAKTGALKLGLDLALTITEDEEGYQVFKDVVGVNLRRGPVVSGIKPGSNVQITPAIGFGYTDIDGYVRGKSRIDFVLPGSEQQEPAITLVALNSVREELIDDAYGGIFYLSFPYDKEASLRGKILVPFEGLVTNPRLLLRFWLLGRASGTLPVLSMSYRRLTRPDAEVPCNPVALPTSDTALEDLIQCAVGANEYVEVESDSFAIDHGEQIYFTLKRTGPDGYAGDVGVLRMSARIVAG